MSSPTASSILTSLQQDNDTTELVPDSLSSSTGAPLSRLSSQQQRPSSRYLPGFSLDVSNSQKEKVNDKSDETQQPYIRFGEEKKHLQRLPRIKVVEKTQESPTASTGMATSIEDISSLRLWKGILAELVGTLLLTMVGCGSCINLRGKDNVTSPVVQIALCFGLTVGTIVWSIAHVSGGHINPAVTVAMLATRKISLAKAVFFILSQLVGAVAGAGILMGLTPESYRGNLGLTTVNKDLNLGQAVGVEFFVTFVLVFTVFASCDGKRRDLNGSAPLAIGLAVTTCHLWAIDFTGSSMNTARTFGPALVTGEWEHHWVYWLGPILGGTMAGILYEHLFAVNASLLKAKACLLTSDYDDEKYKRNKMKIRIIEEGSFDESDGIPLTNKDGHFTSDV